MNDDTLNDLKQFIATTMEQQLAAVVGTLASKDDVANLRQEMQAGFSGVADAIETLGNHLERRLNAHEERLDEHDQALHLLRKRIA